MEFVTVTYTPEVRHVLREWAADFTAAARTFGDVARDQAMILNVIANAAPISNTMRFERAELLALRRCAEDKIARPLLPAFAVEAQVILAWLDAHNVRPRTPHR